MSSKKKRKKLKEKYNPSKYNKYQFHEYNKLQEDRELIYNYLKENPNTTITRSQLIENLPLNYNELNAITSNVKHIAQHYKVFIVSKKGYNGGYIYYA